MSAVTNGTCSANAGRNARRTTAQENNVPRPETGVHTGVPSHAGQRSTGYQTNACARLAARDHEPARRRAREERRGDRVVDIGEREVRALDRHQRSFDNTSVLAMCPV